MLKDVTIKLEEYPNFTFKLNNGFIDVYKNGLKVKVNVYKESNEDYGKIYDYLIFLIESLNKKSEWHASTYLLGKTPIPEQEEIND